MTKTTQDTLTGVLEALKGFKDQIPRERATQEGFLTRYWPNPDYQKLEQAITSLQALIDKPTADDRLLVALKQAITELEEAASIIEGFDLPSMASVFRLAIQRHQQAIEQAADDSEEPERTLASWNDVYLTLTIDWKRRTFSYTLTDTPQEGDEAIEQAEQKGTPHD